MESNLYDLLGALVTSNLDWKVALPIAVLALAAVRRVKVTVEVGGQR